MAHNKIRQPNYLESIVGKVGYWLMVEPDNLFAKHMYDRLTNEYQRRLKKGDN